ncbi:hypothetical protein F2Q69_00012425 [Brassica cretica]|uniref:Uncharacterized protein n=1 Tax=Brassica cretica TaxID=69181 RepID=A0A8S9R4N8_BRACR|nr:hypothetical protein F2Q69_00012425 [Brassica cretica]
MKTYNQVRNNSEKDSHDRSSTKVTQGLGQWITDSETSIVQLAEGESRTGCTDQLARSASCISPTHRTGELDRASRPTRSFGELDQSACLRPVLVAPPFRIRSNLLLFHLDRSHRWSFTI